MSAATLGAEFRRTMSLVRSYWLNYAADLVLYTLGYFLLMAVYFVAADGLNADLALSALIGYVTWKVCASAMVRTARTIVEEAKTGTLEQLFVTGRSPTGLILARSLGEFLNQGLRGLILGTIIAAIMGLLQPVPFSVLIVFTLTAAGALGAGLALAGLALVEKRIGGFLNLIWQMLVFFSGALAPITGPVFGTISRLLPLSWGIEAMRAILLEGATFGVLFDNGLLLGLLVNTGFYLLVGEVLYLRGEKRARELGVLGQY